AAGLVRTLAGHPVLTCGRPQLVGVPVGEARQRGRGDPGPARPPEHPLAVPDELLALVVDRLLEPLGFDPDVVPGRLVGAEHVSPPDWSVARPTDRAGPVAATRDAGSRSDGLGAGPGQACGPRSTGRRDRPALPHCSRQRRGRAFGYGPGSKIVGPE